MDERDSMSLLEAWFLAWRHRWLVFGISSVAVALALVFVLTVTPRFRAEVLLKPSDNRSQSGFSSQMGGLGGLGGLASLAGLNLGADTSAESVAVLSSREFAAVFIQDQNLVPVLFANKWDATQNRWKDSRVEDQPDIRDAVKYFNQNIRNVQEDKKTGFVRMTIEWTDPKVAADWANLLVVRVNETMRNRALVEAEANVAFLKQELTSADVLPLQQSIARVLENELQKLMFAKSNRDYAFKVLDRAEPPRRKFFPQRTLIVISAFLFGVATAVTFILIRHQVRIAHKLHQDPRPGA
jgi:uncharacterized protein involved in exopolysaccharide biosynthesis